MITYITVADVDTHLGSTWATGDAAKTRAVMIANVWLTNLGLPMDTGYPDYQTYPDEASYPDEWIQAGAEIAKDAASGKIFGARETGVLSKTVKADTVSSAKTYSQSTKTYSAGESLAYAMLAPWLPNPNQMKVSRS
ncbi:hypothetical protein [Shewanella fodinae]|uniref:hypothetical protein n=1 Tax=Shewanella fodinae TaxID=552357 RepID=UPI0016790BB3|nr:hypothetical protein [Shewanella fodinae]MCL2905226.1 hypothetical protein [Shewanella fodinae]GGY87635.1 hypothetical protein GCM10007169_00980 [Shewanella fodinae]